VLEKQVSDTSEGVPLKHLIVGAGATLAEALALGNQREDCPPLMSDFAKKTWANYTPHPLLERYLIELGFLDLGDDPRELFYDLEKTGAVNIERFMEYCWRNRHINFPDVEAPIPLIPLGYISGLRISVSGAIDALPPAGEAFWENLLYHGVGSPLQFLTIQCFYENGVGWRDLALSKTIAKTLSDGDLVLNLNYDTIFELALEQLARAFSYVPNVAKDGEIVVCKTHGSLNMISNDSSFTFGQPSWLGMPQASGYRSFSGLVPPRLNKGYDQHPISRMMVQAVHNRTPDAMIFWGIGLTESDIDLLELYRHWARHTPEIVVINPDARVAGKAAELLGLSVLHFPDLTTWCAKSE
jgi:hypothetical protein